MNRGIFSLTVNERTGLITAVPETAGAIASRRGAVTATGGVSKRRARCGRHAVVLVAAALFSWTGTYAAQPPGLQPHPTLQWQNAQIDSARSDARTLTIQQTQAKAILSWKQFNVGPGEKVQFNQNSSSWEALNRIYDLNPSIIQGQISAPGKVYLINQNGIIFDRGSQINVNSLIASTLDIPDSVFNQGINSTRFDATLGPLFTGSGGSIKIEDGAVIRTADGGRVMLFAPNIENRGTISSPGGQSILAAGKAVYITSADNDPNLRGLVVEVDSGGSVTNLGRVIAERGSISMIGMAVNQSGLVKTTTSVSLNGSIYLLARDTVDIEGSKNQRRLIATRGGVLTLGPNSQTQVAIEAKDTSTITDQQQFYPSKVVLSGGSIYLQQNASIVAPGGDVSLVASAIPGVTPTSIEPNGSRVYLAAGSLIDVSGTGSGSGSALRQGEQVAAIPIERNVVEAELRGNELRDAPLLRNSALRGQKVEVDIRKTVNGSVGTDLADVSGYASQIQRGVVEKTAAGGSIKITSEGDIVFARGATLDLSGGAIRYLDGFVNTTKLLTSTGRVVDISAASPNETYVGFADRWVVKHSRWNVTESWSASPSRERGYVEGKSAGSITLAAPAMVLEGAIENRVQVGPYQRSPTAMPAGVSVQIGAIVDARVTDATDFTVRSLVRFADQLTNDAAQIAFDTPLADGLKATLTLGPNIWNTPHPGSLTVYSNREVEVPVGPAVALPAGGSLVLVGRNVTMERDIRIPSGSVTLQARQTAEPAQIGAPVNVTLGRNVVLDMSGLWVNDLLANRGKGDPSAPLFTNGGSVVLKASGNVVAPQGSVIDVSAGGHLTGAGRFEPGAAGQISLEAGAGTASADPHNQVVVLGATLRALSAGQGGTLQVTSGSVRIGGERSGAPGELWLAPELFGHEPDGPAGGPADCTQWCGFQTFTIVGRDGVTVAPDTQIVAKVDSFFLAPSFAGLPGGTPLDQVFAQRQLPLAGTAFVRNPASVTLRATNPLVGNVLLPGNSRIETDPAGTVTLESARSILVDGVIKAPGGLIQLSITKVANDDVVGGSYVPEQAIWLGTNSVLTAAGEAKSYVETTGRRLGDVLAGGAVNLWATTGFVASESGSLIDVSGTSALLDLPAQAGVGQPYIRQQVASSAGSISVRAREGVFLDGTMRARGGAADRGNGSLEVSLDRSELRDIDLTTTGDSSRITYPLGPRELIVRQAGSAIPAGLVFGAILPLSENGKAYVSRAQIDQAGFDNVTLKSRNHIQIQDSVSLALRGALTLDAPVITVNNDATAQLRARSVVLGNTDFRYQGQEYLEAPHAGTGVLEVSASLVDLVGTFSLSGVEHAVLRSDGDVRVRAVAVQSDLRPTGEMTTPGNVSVVANQLYPVSFGQYTIRLTGPGTTFRLDGAGAASIPLSVGGSLSIVAPIIEQAGVLRAPLGQLHLQAAERVTLLPGSLTSVAAQGQLIPLGSVVNGTSWVYDLGLNTGQKISISQAPEKQIDLQSGAVEILPGAKLDLNGGGDLYAYEFTPGPGGSADVLNKPGVYAILPGLNLPFAPYDYQNTFGTDLKTGDAVYLSGMAGLPAGTYTLLPAHYALLPGAYTVTSRAGTRDILPQQGYGMLDGSAIVAGYRVQSDGSNRDARWSGFQVAPGAVARTQSQFTDSFATKFFAPNGSAPTGARLPTDAGLLAITAGSSLVLEGTVSMGHSVSARGGQLNVAADLILLSDTAVAAQGVVRVSSSALQSTGAESILIGGRREETADGTIIHVTSKTLEVNTAGEAPLSLAELLLVASDEISIGAGSRLRGVAQQQAPASQFIVGDDTVAGSGDGALLRLSSGQQANLVRRGVTRTQGRLNVMQGAELESGRIVMDPTTKITRTTGGSALVDATLTTTLEGTLNIAPGGAVKIGAQRIAIGGPADSNALVLTSERLDGWQNLSQLALISYTSVEFRTAATLGNTSLDSLTINASSIVGSFDGPGMAGFTAKSIQLTNNVGSAPTAQATQSARGIEFRGDEIVAGPGDITLVGFQTQKLSAANRIVARGQGAFNASGDLVLAAGSINADGGSDRRFTSPGTLTVAGLATDTTTPPNSIGGSLTLDAVQVRVSGTIDVPAGRISINASGSGDSIILDSGARLAATGASRQFGPRTVAAPGGTITLSAANGNVRVAEGGVVDVTGIAGGDAGTLEIIAPMGTLDMQGRFLGWTVASDAGAGQQGTFHLDVATLSALSPIAAALALSRDEQGKPTSGGFQQAISLHLQRGDLNLEASDTVSATRVELSTDDGQISIRGTIDASGPKGGSIRLAAGVGATGTGNVAIDTTGRLLARATDPAGSAAGSVGNGGSILIGTSTQSGLAPEADRGRISIASGAILDVSGAGGGAGGQVSLRAPRLGANAGTDVAVDRVDGTIVGAQSVVIEAFKVYGSSSTDELTLSGQTGAGKINVGVFADDNTTFAANFDAIKARLGQIDNVAFHMRPGVEVRTGGNLVVSVNETDVDPALRGWNLQSLRYAGEPGVLTLRAGGDLELRGSISDGFVQVAGKAMSDWTLAAGDSWSYRLVGGSDLTAANPLQVLRAPSGTSGNVKVTFADVSTPSSVIRTGNGTIEVAAARNVELGVNAVGADPSRAVIYTAGVPDSTDYSALGAFNSATTAGIVFPRGGGDIWISAGGDITGAPTNQVVADWLYRQGSLSTTGVTAGTWTNTAWWPQFSQFRQNIGALGGGDVTIAAGGTIRDLSAVIPSSGRYFLDKATGVKTAVLTGGGDLSVSSGGDILGGVFLVGAGDGRLKTEGALGPGSNAGGFAPMLAVGNGHMRVYAGADVTIETVFSPTMLPQTASNASTPRSLSRSFFFTYDASSSVDIASGTGDIVLRNDRVQLESAATGLAFTQGGDDSAGFVIYPPTTRVAALTGSINVEQSFSLYPAARGTLELLAGNSIKASGYANVSDLNPAATLPATDPTRTFDLSLIGRLLTDQLTVYGGAIYHGSTPLHAGDNTPAIIYASDGDITGVVGFPTAYLPKRAVVHAGRDIRNATLIVQHSSEQDVTEISAGRDLVFDVATVQNALTTNASRIAVGGPGTLDVVAGRNIDLGNSEGILGRGNLDNPNLGPLGVDIALLAGATSANYGGFANYYLHDNVATATQYAPQLERYVRSMTRSESPDAAMEAFHQLSADEQRQYLTVSPGQAWADFQQLSPELQRPFLREVMFSELRESGRDFSAQGTAAYDRGYAAIQKLFPEQNHSGRVNVVFSQIKTEQGGAAYYQRNQVVLDPADLVSEFVYPGTNGTFLYRDKEDRMFHQGGNIDILVPGGDVVVGLSQVPASLTATKRRSTTFDDSASRLGIVAVDNGSVRSMSKGDVLVNQSRVFTLGGGDIVLWSSEGNVDAGKGAKTSASAPPPLITTDALGNTVVQIQGAVSGAGIGVLIVQKGVEPGDTFLIAPKGEVNAGDAGIRAAGNLTIAAVRVVGAENIQVGGASSGVPLAGGTSLAASVGTVADAGAQAAKNVERAIGETGSDTAGQKGLMPSLITVEVIGIGDDDADRRRSQDSQ